MMDRAMMVVMVVMVVKASCAGWDAGKAFG
jgi:hypothetical protein